MNELINYIMITHSLPIPILLAYTAVRLSRPRVWTVGWRDEVFACITMTPSTWPAQPCRMYLRANAVGNSSWICRSVGIASATPHQCARVLPITRLAWLQAVDVVRHLRLRSLCRFVLSCPDAGVYHDGSGYDTKHAAGFCSRMFGCLTFLVCTRRTSRYGLVRGLGLLSMLSTFRLNK